MSDDMMKQLLDSHRRLGLRLTSSDEQVKSAYRKLAFELHPDRKGVSPQAGEAAFKQVQQDFENIQRFREVHRAAEQAAAAAQHQHNSASYAQTAARTAAGAQKTAGSAVRRFGTKGVMGTLGLGALLVGAGLMVETVKYRYVKPQIENSKIVRRMSNIYGSGGPFISSPMEDRSH